MPNFAPASARGHLCFAAAVLAVAFAAFPVFAQSSNDPSSTFSRALAEAASDDEAVAQFYRLHGFQPLWTSAQDADRRLALLTALSLASDQGLPASRYDAEGLIQAAENAVTEGDRGRVEMAFTNAYLLYARDVASGALEPKNVTPGVLREIVRPKSSDLLQGIATAPRPLAFMRALAPQAPQYARLVKEKLSLEAALGSETAIPAENLSLGDKGPAVISLRERLVERGYIGRSATAVFDAEIEHAVQRFQLDQMIVANGEAGASTITALNQTVTERLQSVTVALERMRWMGKAPLGARHIWVNQPSFVAQIVDEGRVTFETRAVIGKNIPEQESPEFSDMMEYMVVNPSWGVPRSILVKEYLPLLKKNRNAVRQLDVVDANGRVVPRGAVNFAAYSASSFPFGLRQPPSDGNALGKVKFMFPNTHNIYLHDTPAKALFANEVRAYSHGCIRLGDPLDFAYALLAKQSSDPKGDFQKNLSTKQESSVSLTQPVPVHLVYYTAWPTRRGAIGYRPDIYGRDVELFKALTNAGVVLEGDKG